MSTDVKSFRRSWVTPMDDPARQIRLLTLPEQTAQNGVVNLRLETFDLSLAPPYLALSYTWGSPFLKARDKSNWEKLDRVFTVSCNGEEVEVSQNLMEALQHVPPHYPARLIWIDALCIDQKNETELHQQVRIMSEVYTRADMVVIWLGVSDRYVQKLAYLYDIFRQVGKEAWSVDKNANKVTNRHLGGRDYALVINDCLEGAMLCVYHRTWWVRKWTFQEFMMAKAVSMICGDFAFDVDVLENLLQGITTPGLLSPLLEMENATTKMLLDDRYLNLMNDRRNWSAEGIPNGVFKWELDNAFGAHNFPAILSFLLIRTTLRAAKEPRDIVFGVMGLCKVLAARLSVDEPTDDVFDPLAPAHQLFESIAKYLHLGTPVLILLECCGDGVLDQNRPSWLPDFTFLDGPEFNTPEIKGCRAGSLEHTGECRGGARQFKAIVSSQGTGFEESLGLRAIKAGTVKLKVEFPDTYFRRDGGMIATLQSDWELLEKVLHFSQTIPAEHRVDVGRWALIWRSCLTGHQRFSLNDIRQWSAYTVALMTKKPQFKVLDETLHGSWPDLSCFDKDALKTVLGFDTFSDAASILSNVVESRTQTLADIFGQGGPEVTFKDLMHTRDMLSRKFRCPTNCMIYVDKGWIGTSRRVCKEGDEVWILEGGRKPFLLRPTASQGQFRIVGPAYIEDVMHGEVIRDRGPEPGWENIWLV